MNFEILSAILLAGTVAASNVHAAGVSGGVPVAADTVLATGSTFFEARGAAIEALKRKHLDFFKQPPSGVTATKCRVPGTGADAVVLVAWASGGTERTYATVGRYGNLLGQEVFGAVQGDLCGTEWPRDFEK